jgi:hypothetical protein
MGSKAIVLWLAGGVGVILLYAAYKGLSPTSIVTGALASKTTVKKTTTDKGNTPSGGSTVTTTEQSQVPSEALQDAADSGTYEGLVQQGSSWWTADQYGNPVSEVPAAYGTNPGTYIPPNMGY